MDVHDLEAAFQDVLDCATGDAGSFADSWQFFVDFVQQQDLVSQQAALLAEVVLGSQDESLLQALQDSKDKQGRQASKTRRAVINWLNELVQQLEPVKLQQSVPAIIDAALALVKASTAEDVATKVAALGLLSFILSQQVAGKLPVQLLPAGPLDLASPMQRVFLSSDARSNKTLKHALLASGAAGVPGASTIAALRFDASSASGGAIEGLIAALSMMQMCEELLKAPPKSSVALAWLTSLVSHCSSQLAAGGFEGALAAGGGGGGWMRGAVEVGDPDLLSCQSAGCARWSGQALLQACEIETGQHPVISAAWAARDLTWSLLTR
eukprot:gene9975-10129_t